MAKAPNEAVTSVKKPVRDTAPSKPITANMPVRCVGLFMWKINMMNFNKFFSIVKIMVGRGDSLPYLRTNISMWFQVWFQVLHGMTLYFEEYILNVDIFYNLTFVWALN